MKDILSKVLRMIIALVILTIIVLGFIYIPTITVAILTIILALFIYSELPYKIIASIYRKITNSNYVCITLPFQDRFITIKKKNYVGSVNDRIKRHEEDHIKYFNERFTIIQCIIYLTYLIWYGYYNNPIEVRARKAENRVM